MTTEDYNKYYIQGSDHYLIPRDELKILLRENQELKKQLKNSIKVNMADHKYASECEDKVVTLEAYQKKFTKWLEDEIHTIETTYSQINGNYGLMNEKLEALKEVLREYKKIIGVENENKTTI